MAEQCKENIQPALRNDDQTLAAAKKAQEYLERLDNISLNIAITGESGSGKSTLVNALRGIRNKTEGAAPTGVKETTIEPTEYIHPQNKNIRIWDLPGVITTRLKADEYLEYVGLERFDFFIIVSSDRFGENYVKLAKEIQKTKKKFYFVRSKVDHNIQDEKEEDPNVKEEEVLDLIRSNSVRELQELGHESPKVFLVSGLRLHLYEFKDFWKTLEEELGIIMADKWKAVLQTELQNNDLPQAAKMVLDYLDKLNNVPLNIAITGESGSGKSTLVNALRGIKNRTEGAAPTGVVETTMEPTKYLHPENPNIRIWDLPGIGTTNFTADKYLQYVGFEKYDFFIIVSSERFSENDAKLAKEIQKMKKKFYFVRSKIDHNIRDEKEESPNFNEENLLKLIRDNCTKELKKLDIESPKVFLVSGFRLHLYEFEDLWKTLQEELPKLQRDALLLALPNISANVIKQKKKTLERKIKWLTVASVAGGAAVPIPGLSADVDLNIITAFTVHCAVSLGLTPELLKKLSDVSGVPLDNLRAELKSPLAGVEITTNHVIKVLVRSSTHITAMAVEEGARFVPFIGISFGMSPSTVITNKALKYILNSLAADAQQVFQKAVGLNTSV